MNKQDWTYKTFGEVGTFLRGKSIQKADFVEKGMPCIHYGQIHTKFGVSIDKHLSEIPLELYNKSIIASHGDVIIAITSEDLEGSCKSTAWLGDYDIAVSSHAAVYKHNLNPKFIAYYLRSKSFYYEKMKYARGFKVMEIKPTDIERIPIPVPPLAEQKRIVAELDLLQGIIEKKKEQLKAYDQLAQSIFYSMFGDISDTAFPIKCLNDVCEFIKDGTHQTPTYTDDKENGVKFLSAKDVVGGTINWDNIKYIPIDLHKELHKRIAPQRNDILLCKNGTTGICAIVETDEIFDIYVSLALLRPRKPNCPKYLLYAINNPLTKEQFNRSLKGVGVPNLHIGEIKKARIIYPPLSLQQEFAEKVEAIERQKALVQQSIVETQTMFDCTMDKYFG